MENLSGISSSHDFSLVLSREAFDDLVDIQAYTYEAYGEAQWEKYGALLDTAMQHLINHPFSGHSRNDIPDKYLAWNAGEHVMIYRVEEDVIYLVRVLHQRMDFGFRFI